MFAKVMKELSTALVRATRDDGSRYYRITDDAPAWLQGSDVMLQIHGALDDRLPDDWVYEAVSSIADAFVDHSVDDEDEARDAVDEIADGLVDVYNADRLRWVASHLGNAGIVDEACDPNGDAGGCPPETDLCDRIGRGQCLAYTRLAHAVIEAVETEASTRDEDE